MKHEQAYYSPTDLRAACYPELLLSWRHVASRHGAPGLAGYLELGPGVTTDPDGNPYGCYALVSGVMDDFGTFVVTEVKP